MIQPKLHMHNKLKRKPLIVTPVSVVEALVATLRQHVLHGDLQPDTLLAELHLATRYSVARPTIRAALHQLTLTGLVRRDANRSAIVPRLTQEEVVDLFFVRKMVESEAVRRIAGRRLRPWAAEQAVHRLESFGPTARRSDFVETDLEFHRAIVNATDSLRLSRQFGMLEDEIRLCVVQLAPASGSPAALGREYHQLLKAVEGGATKRAITLLEDHFNRTIETLEYRGKEEHLAMLESRNLRDIRTGRTTRSS